MMSGQQLRDGYRSRAWRTRAWYCSRLQPLVCALPPGIGSLA
jgi:hypothetical protein